MVRSNLLILIRIIELIGEVTVDLSGAMRNYFKELNSS